MKRTTDIETINAMLRRLGIDKINNGASNGISWIPTKGEVIESYSPADGRLIGKVKQATPLEYEMILTDAENAFKTWRMVPAPARGETVRQFANAFREHKTELGMLVSYEMGKGYQ
jgi:aldehyde dehydrogenase (NAD+)